MPHCAVMDVYCDRAETSPLFGSSGLVGQTVLNASACSAGQQYVKGWGVACGIAATEAFNQSSLTFEEAYAQLEPASASQEEPRELRDVLAEIEAKMYPERSREELAERAGLIFQFMEITMGREATEAEFKDLHEQQKAIALKYEEGAQ